MASHLPEYIPTPWVNGVAPAINSTNLGHIENGIQTVTDATLLIEDGTTTVGRAAVADSLAPGVTVDGTPPIGTMVIWPTETAPIDWEICRGQDMSTSTYPELFSLIGSTFGSTSPAVFSLPDTRGLFIRGYDPSNINDPDTRVFGDSQEDTLKAHDHTLTEIKRNGYTSEDPRGYANAGTDATISTDLTGDLETRPKNITLSYIMRVL